MPEQLVTTVAGNTKFQIIHAPNQKHCIIRNFNLRFGRVERIGRVADVLGAVEHPERQPGQEVAR